MTAPAPYYTTPNIHRDNNWEGGRLDVNPGDTSLMLVLGSDLVLWVDKSQKDTDHGAQDWLIAVCDSNANHLAVLAVLPGDLAKTTVLPLVPAAAETARALFPNHLLTEL